MLKLSNKLHFLEHISIIDPVQTVTQPCNCDGSCSDCHTAMQLWRILFRLLHSHAIVTGPVQTVTQPCNCDGSCSDCHTAMQLWRIVTFIRFTSAWCLDLAQRSCEAGLEQATLVDWPWMRMAWWGAGRPAPAGSVGSEHCRNNRWRSWWMSWRRREGHSSGRRRSRSWDSWWTPRWGSSSEVGWRVRGSGWWQTLWQRRPTWTWCHPRNDWSLSDHGRRHRKCVDYRKSGDSLGSKWFLKELFLSDAIFWRKSFARRIFVCRKASMSLKLRKVSEARGTRNIVRQ